MADEGLIERLDQRLAAMGLSARAASIEATGKPDTIRDIRSGKSRNPRFQTIQQLARVLETTPDWLLGADASAPTRDIPPPGVPVDLPLQSERDLPVFGLAAGSGIGALTMTSEPVEYIPCPPGLARVRDAYALIVTGSSMEPRYEAGDVVFLNPHRPPRQGDHVVIQEAREGGTIVTIKRFERWTDDALITTQYSPLREVHFPREQIVAVHRVLTTNELLGV